MDKPKPLTASDYQREFFMKEDTLDVIDRFEKLDTTAKIRVLEWAYHNYGHAYDYATMPESLRRFYDPTSIRPSKEKGGGE